MIILPCALRDSLRGTLPFWDGEDDVFDIESLTEEDISQVPNLKTIDGTAILMSEQVKNFCKEEGISFIDESMS